MAAAMGNRLPDNLPGGANPRKWLRRLHAWCGLVLVALLMFFAVTGFLLNHRAVLKIPALDKREVQQVQTLEQPAANPESLAGRLELLLGVPAAALKLKIEPARQLEWNGTPVEQPARWLFSADTPSESIRVDYWAGSRQFEVRRSRPNLWLHLARLHMATGAGTAWILFSDGVALGLAFLGFSGFWLWGRLHGSRRRLAALASGGLMLAAGLGWLAG